MLNRRWWAIAGAAVVGVALLVVVNIVVINVVARDRAIRRNITQLQRFQAELAAMTGQLRQLEAHNRALEQQVIGLGQTPVIAPTTTTTLRPVVTTAQPRPTPTTITTGTTPTTRPAPVTSTTTSSTPPRSSTPSTTTSTVPPSSTLLPPLTVPRL